MTRASGGYFAQLAAIRASYTDDKRAEEARSDVPARYLYRPLSFPITPPFMMLGVSANGVTVLGILISAGVPLCALLGGLRGALAIALLSMFIQVLDCVDGNIARTTGKTSKAGRMLDGLGSLLFWASYFLGIGMLAAREPEPFFAAHGTELGLALALLLLVQRELEDTFDSYFGQRVRWQPPVPNAPELDLGRFGRVLEHVVGFGGLVLAAWLGRISTFLVLLGGYQCTLFVLWLVRYWRTVAERADEP
jgi:phosphatidylglycerophosphate synthase